MQTRPSALGLLSTIRPLTQNDNTLESARAELAAFFSTLDTNPLSPLSPEEKTKLHDNVAILRAFLLTQLINMEKKQIENPSYTNVYNTLMLLAQCFPLNEKNEYNQILASSSSENDKIPINNQNRFIAANGYWYKVPNLEYERKFDEYEIDPYLPSKESRDKFNISQQHISQQHISQQDINRATLLVNQYPQSGYAAKDKMTAAMTLGMGAGLVTTIILLLFLTVATGGAAALAGLGIGILGLIVGGMIQGANIGIAFKTTKDLISNYFKNRKINHIDVPDFANEESKINSLFYIKNVDQSLPVAAKAETQKPYFSMAFKKNLSDRASIGIVIGAVIGIVATAALLIFGGPAAVPAIALFAILFGPSIGLPTVFGIERIVSHSVSFVKEKLKKPSVTETHEVIQPSQTKTLTPDLSHTHEPSPTNNVYPVIKKTKQDIVNIAFSKLIRTTSYEEQAIELTKKIGNLIMQIKKHEHFEDGAETFGYATAHAAYLIAKEDILNKMARITSPQKKNDFLDKIDILFLDRMKLICNPVSMNTSVNTQLFFSPPPQENVNKKIQSNSAAPKPSG